MLPYITAISCRRARGDTLTQHIGAKVTRTVLYCTVMYFGSKRADTNIEQSGIARQGAKCPRPCSRRGSSSWGQRRTRGAAASQSGRRAGHIERVHVHITHYCLDLNASHHQPRDTPDVTAPTNTYVHKHKTGLAMHRTSAAWWITLQRLWRPTPGAAWTRLGSSSSIAKATCHLKPWAFAKCPPRTQTYTACDLTLAPYI